MNGFWKEMYGGNNIKYNLVKEFLWEVEVIECLDVCLVIRNGNLR